MYKACIFDLDGTLTDTLESLIYSVNATLKELKLPCITADQCRQFVGNGAKVLLEKALKAAGDVKLTKIEEAEEVYKRIFGINCTYKVKPYEGIPELLAYMKEAGLKLAVLSNKPHGQTTKVVKTFFGEELFSHVQGQCDKIKRKPDPAGVLYILEQLGVLPEECVYVGDSEVDIRTGEAAGTKTIGVTWGFRTREMLGRAGAKDMVDCPEELKKWI